MQIIIKIAVLLLSIILILTSFYLAGSGQESYFYTACGFGLAGILVFIMFMREKKPIQSKNSGTAAQAGIDNNTEGK